MGCPEKTGTLAVFGVFFYVFSRSLKGRLYIKKTVIFTGKNKEVSCKHVPSTSGLGDSKMYCRWCTRSTDGWWFSHQSQEYEVPWVCHPKEENYKCLIPVWGTLTCDIFDLYQWSHMDILDTGKCGICWLLLLWFHILNMTTGILSWFLSNHTYTSSLQNPLSSSLFSGWLIGVLMTGQDISKKSRWIYHDIPFPISNSEGMMQGYGVGHIIFLPHGFQDGHSKNGTSLPGLPSPKLPTQLPLRVSCCCPNQIYKMDEKR